jgi:hypothetical protein
VQDSRKFYKRLIDTKKPFEPAVCKICWATNGQLLTDKDQVLSRWKEYFEQHWNKSSKDDAHANQEPPRENDVIIDLPNRDKIVEAIKYFKDNK